MFCNNCGGYNIDNSKFCKFCGSALMPDFSEANNYSGYSKNTCNASTLDQNYTNQTSQSKGNKSKIHALSIVSLVISVFSILAWVVCQDYLYMLIFLGFPMAIVGVALSSKDRRIGGANVFNIVGTILSIIAIPLNIYFIIMGSISTVFQLLI